MAALVAGITIYLVFPTLIAVFGSWPKLKSLNPLWFLVALVAQVAHFTCTIALQRLALRTKAWFSVATSQLAGNAISLVVPGGQAAGAATQFRMLAASGSDPATAVGGLTAISILGIGGLLALPIFVLPAIIAGTPIDRGLEHAALLGIGAFFLFAGFSAVVLVVDGPMRWAGRRHPGGAQQGAAQADAPDRAARQARARAQPHPRRAGPPVEGRPPALERAAGLRLHHAAGVHLGHGDQAASPRSCCWPTRWPGCSGWSRSRRAGWASSRPA